MTPLKVVEALRWASSFLQENNREAAAAEWLLCHHLNVNKTELFLRLQEILPADVQQRWMNDVKSYESGIPMQHLTGSEMFYGRRFSVNRDVLIPRPETEELVAGVLVRMNKNFHDKNTLHVADVGTGSGIIGVTLALERNHLRVRATDISEAALQTAKKNATVLGADITFFQGDLLQPLIDRGEKYDVIVSNPPYISKQDVATLDPLVKDHEPRMALTDGEDGFAMYRRLIAQLPFVITENALVAFEVGEGQSPNVAEILKETIRAPIKTAIIKDINGKERMVFAGMGAVEI